MALKHIDHNFTQSSIELSTNFLQALTALKYTYIHQATENTLEKQINIYFRDGEAHGIFLVLICSPVNTPNVFMMKAMTRHRPCKLTTGTTVTKHDPDPEWTGETIVGPMGHWSNGF